MDRFLEGLLTHIFIQKYETSLSTPSIKKTFEMTIVQCLSNWIETKKLNLEKYWNKFSVTKKCREKIEKEMKRNWRKKMTWLLSSTLGKRGVIRFLASQAFPEIPISCCRNFLFSCVSLLVASVLCFLNFCVSSHSCLSRRLPTTGWGPRFSPNPPPHPRPPISRAQSLTWKPTYLKDSYLCCICILICFYICIYVCVSLCLWLFLSHSFWNPTT